MTKYSCMAHSENNSVWLYVVSKMSKALQRHCVSVHLQERHGENFYGYLCEEISTRQIPALEARKGYIHHWSHKAYSRIHPWSKSMATAEEESKKSIQEVMILPPPHPTQLKFKDCLFAFLLFIHCMFIYYLTENLRQSICNSLEVR